MKEKLQNIIDDLIKELERAQSIHSWPDDIIHQAAIVNEESGELIQASLNHYYKQEDIDQVKKEAIHTGATVIRFLLNLKDDSE